MTIVPFWAGGRFGFDFGFGFGFGLRVSQSQSPEIFFGVGIWKFSGGFATVVVNPSSLLFLRLLSSSSLCPLYNLIVSRDSCGSWRNDFKLRSLISSCIGFLVRSLVWGEGIASGDEMYRACDHPGMLVSMKALVWNVLSRFEVFLWWRWVVYIPRINNPSRNWFLNSGRGCWGAKILISLYFLSKSESE